MAIGNETLDRSEALSVGLGLGAPRAPGLILVFTAGRPAATPVALERGEITLGRDHPAFARHPDGRMSRSHARVRFDGRRFEVTDLESRNGTSADGVALERGAHRELGRVVRVGDSLLAPVGDLGPLARLGVRTDGARVEGPALQEVLAAVAHAARLGTTLHVTGESGAGKEGLARAFHAAGPAPGGPFQAVNCATIPEGVAERLLFGAKRGAFSGADADADGYVQAAHGGTLFLDEVESMPMTMQIKLLRVLQERVVERLGSNQQLPVDCRVVAATKDDLKERAERQTFRADLYYRLNVVTIDLPPLRERREDIPLLLEHFLLLAAARHDRPLPAVPPEQMRRLMAHTWPGNVRELRNVADCIVLGVSTEVLGGNPADTPPASLAESVDSFERSLIAAELRRQGGSLARSAEALRVAKTTLHDKIRKSGLGSGS